MNQENFSKIKAVIENQTKIVKKKTSEIYTDSSDDEDETLDLKIKTLSAEKIFGKRMSFDYHNLLNIEKISIRKSSLSEIKKKDIFEAEIIEKKIENENKTHLVKFNSKSEEINDQANDQKKIKNKKNRSILKKTCFEESLNLNKVFMFPECKELIKSIEEDAEKKKVLVKNIIFQNFQDFWNSKRENSKFRFDVIKVKKILVHIIFYSFKRV